MYYIEFNIKDFVVILSILGGFGRRVRRGFGSFRILKIDEKYYSFEYNLLSILNLINGVSMDKYKIENNKIKLKETQSTQYPFLKEIQIGKEYNSWEGLVKKIGEVSHNHNIDSLGFAKSKNRLASPIYVSVLKELKNNKYLPIISTLNTVFEDNRQVDYDGQDAFKEAIL